MAFSIARVIINSPVKALDRVFDYNIPLPLDGKVVPGVRVAVPFGGGNRKKEGYVIALSEKSEYQGVKDIASVLDNEPLLGEAELLLAAWIRKRYLSTWCEAIRLMLPPGTQLKVSEWVSLNEEKSKEDKLSPKQAQVIALLKENGGCLEYSSLVARYEGNLRNVVHALEKKGIVTISHRDHFAVREKTMRLAYYAGDEDPSHVVESLLKRAPKEAEVIRLLWECGRLSNQDIMLSAGCSQGVITALYKKGYIDYETVSVRRDPRGGKTEKSTKALDPTPEQKKALSAILDKIDKEERHTFLLRGVTGSGKTEVYLQAIERVLEKGKGALVLVPEISLTPQMTARFTARFGENVAILHSALSLGERLDEWNRIKRGEARVVVGARSAIFAPLSSIGIIIVDEEHESTYQSETSPRYHAGEVARFRAAQHSACTVLASATPSVTSYYRAEQGRYTLLTMEERYNNAPLPAAEIVDMRQELSEGNRSVLSSRLREEIAQNIKNGEQTVLFLNRRGFSTFVSCRDCGFVAQCPNCSISLTYHKHDNSLSCHYCGYKIKNYDICPSCKGRHIRYFGTGTQKVEEEIKECFPEASVLRMDVDTTGGKQSHERILTEFEEKNVNILLGTQMVSKGLDFPNITLVGILAADMSLNVDDFRAAERTFDLITQVCGRAGRGDKRGRAIIQTYLPDDPTVQLAKNQDYLGFYHTELEFRKMFSYPPFCDIVSVTFTGRNEEEVRGATLSSAKEMTNLLKINGLFDKCVYFAPQRAPLYKIKQNYRWRYWMKCSADKIEDVLHRAQELFYEKRMENVRISIERNPINMY